MSAKEEIAQPNFYQDFLMQTKDFTIDFISGSVGGTACVAVGQPLDTVKVKLQTFPSLYSGMTQCFFKTLKQDGMRGLYAGTAPALIANIAENSVLFAAYGSCQKCVAKVAGEKKVEKLSAVENASAGFFAAFFSSLTLCPTELVKCRLQAMRELSLHSKKNHRSRITAWQLTRSIVKADGMAGMFRGLTSTMTREMPGYFFFFGGYELSRTFFANGKSKDDIGIFKTAISGGIAGATLWTAVFPTDVVKSRIQVSGSKESMISVFKTIIRREGFAALYNGYWPCVIRAFPATAALFIAYEYTKKLFT